MREQDLKWSMKAEKGLDKWNAGWHLPKGVNQKKQNAKGDKFVRSR